ncbi:MAG: helicase-exonuclease AddAB subunit AddA [Clostridia bacterium]|nr:helicase-exonuclease AddAB subunit AddA [Clostridia bacterium]
MKWTPEQLNAINKTGNLLVSAAAGSGKTAVLTERIVRLITEGAKSDDFLVVTFTKAAASEMKKRIEKKLRENAAAFQQDGQSELASRLNDAASSIGRAHISTLHSFCARLLRRHFNLAGLDPAFRVGDDTEIAIYRKDAIDALIEEYYEHDESGDFSLLTEVFGGDERFSDIVLKLFENMFSRPEPFEYLRSSVEAYNISADELASSKAVKEFLNTIKETLKAELDAYSATREDYALTPSFEKAVIFMDEEMMKLRALLLIDTYADMQNALSSFEFVRMTCFARGTSEEDKAPLKKSRDILKKKFAEFNSVFSLSLESHAKRLNDFYPLMCCLASFMEDFCKKYGELKSENAIIDYTDMEHLTLALLKNELIVKEYQNKFKYIFVDEYQDSNLVQEKIISLIKREDNLFLVGDVKQSIYGFRLAEPKLFTEKYDLYADSAFGSRIDLNANFRSSLSVIDRTNEIFSIIMHRENCDIEYDENAALKSGVATIGKGNVELHLIDRSTCIEEIQDDSEASGGDNDDEDNSNENTERGLNRAEAEARLAAVRIRQIISSEEYTDPHTGESRPYRYCDFAILHHSPRNIASHFVKTLASEGIPALSDHSGDYFDAVEVQIFMNLLRIIDNRRQDIPLVSVLRSVIGGFTTEELIRLTSTYRDASKNEAVIDALIKASCDDTLLGNKSRKLLQNIEAWRYESKLLNLPEFLNMLLDETHFYEFVCALSGGDVRSNNLDALITRAQSFTSNGARSLSAFIAYMDKASTHSNESPVMKSNSDVVSVLSIHKSKGLEYPVVILAGLDARFNETDSKSPLLTDGELGIGICPVVNNTRLDTIYRRSILSKLHKKNIAERMRLLYVAMTRAKEQLILIGAVDNVQKRYSEASKVLTPTRALYAHSFLDWLMYLNIQPHIHMAQSISLSDNELDESEYKRFASQASLSLPNDSISPFAWTYPYIEATTIPAKISVSSLSDNPVSKRTVPYFAVNTSANTALKKGTATHSVMELISIKLHTQESVKQELENLVLSGYMLKEDAESVNIASIVGFFESDIGKRLCASKRVERELKFNHRISASSVLDIKDGQSDEKILLQGMIDCAFIEDNEWVLIDYKTDYVAYPSEKFEAAKKHEKQLSLYEDALSTLTGIPVKEKYIYFLRLHDGAVKL